MVDYVKQDMKLLWAELGDYVAPTNEKITQGWLVEVPPRQYWNWLENRQDKQLAYLTQKGFAEWDNTLEYIINKSYVQHNGVVYKCVRTNTGVTPGTSTLDWVVAFTTSTAASEALKAVTPAANMLPYFTSTTAASTTSLTAFARTILDDADAATVRTTISAQTLNANLTAISGLTSAANKLPYFTGSGTAATTDLSAFGRSLIDDADAAAARNTLGLGSLAVQSDGSISITGGTISGITDLAIEDGGTGASTAAGARTNLGLGTAAVANVTTSTVDTTAGRLLKVGDFGLGGAPILWSPASGTIADSANTIQNAFFSDGSGSVTDKPVGASAVRWMNIGNSSWPLQLASNAYNNRMWMRTRASASGTFNDWSEFYHTGNVASSAQTLMSSGVLPDAGLSGNYTGVNISGNAGTATALQTARTINGVSFNGTANITIADATKLPLTGGTMTGQTNYEAGAVEHVPLKFTSGSVLRWAMGRAADGNTFYLWHYNTSGAYLRQFSFNGSTGVLSATSFSGSGSGLTDIPATKLTGVVPDANLSGTYTGVSITGNAATATKLATARTINGVAFDGSANITISSTDATKLPLAGGNLTGVLGVVDGTAAAPGITFAADTDTGIYRVGTNALGITTGGSVAADFDSAGNTNVYGRLRSAGNMSSAAWTTTGCSFDLAAATFTDTSSAASATVATRAAATINTPTFASTNAITVTNAATLYINARPTAGTNTTITNGWALWINSGDSRFGGNITATGNITASGNVTAYSDIRLKTDIQVIPNALEKVSKIRGVTYERIDSGERHTGVIAQEVKEVLPEAVVDGDEHMSVAYGNMVGLLVEAIKELNMKVDALQAEVIELRGSK